MVRISSSCEPDSCSASSMRMRNGRSGAVMQGQLVQIAHHGDTGATARFGARLRDDRFEQLRVGAHLMRIAHHHDGMTQGQIVQADIEQQRFAEPGVSSDHTKTAIAAGVFEALDTVGMSVMGGRRARSPGQPASWPNAAIRADARGSYWSGSLRSDRSRPLTGRSGNNVFEGNPISSLS